GDRAEGAVEAGALAGVAGAAALLLDDEEQGVTVTVVEGGPHPLTVAGGVSLAPALLPAAGPEDGPPRLEGLSHGVGVHPAHHEDRPGGVVLHDGGHQAVSVVADLGQLIWR